MTAAWFLVALTVCFMAFGLATDLDACISGVHNDDKVDEVKTYQENTNHVSNSNLQVAKRFDLDEYSCNSMQCAYDDVSDTNKSIPSVWARGLVTPKLDPKLIVQEHARAASDVNKNFRGETLGYVTPWNSRGYDWAKRFRTKFSYISPTWLQVREDYAHVPIITGTHDIDVQWIHDVKYGAEGEHNQGIGPAVVPRIVYERRYLKPEDLPLITYKMLTLTTEYDFDGIVFEIPVIDKTLVMLQQMAQVFRAAKKLLIVVLPRSSNDGEMAVTHELFAKLAPLVHRFSMNAYDFNLPGPNAPYPWLKKTLEKMSPMERQRILMGLPFYGYDNAAAMTGSSYIQSLNESKVATIRWDKSSHECHHEYTRNTKKNGYRVVFFPCLQFLQDRLKLYKEYGVGVAIWELGQGLDYFYDLL